MNPCGCNLADCVACNEWNGSQWERYEEDGPMDLEDQLDAALNAAFPAQVKCLYPLHHGWHDRKDDCVYPMASSEFSDSAAPKQGNAP